MRKLYQTMNLMTQASCRLTTGLGLALTLSLGLGITAASVPAQAQPATGKNESHPAGEAMGYIIQLKNGFKIWHMGDTGLFGDMKFIYDRYKPNLVLIPIGGNFTMDPEDAAFAMKNWIPAQSVIPIHHGSNPLAKGTPAEFIEAMKGSSKIIVMTEGQTVEF